MKVLRFLAPLLAAAATLCCGAGVAQAAAARPAAGNGFTVSLAASSTDPHVGTAVTAVWWRFVIIGRLSPAAG
jgi:hypothetical protein